MTSRAASLASQAINPAFFPLVLYKRILRLHYGLPLPARIMGDAYVKDEFRRHVKVPPDQALIFLREWTEYCVALSKQLSHRGIVKGQLGKDFQEEQLNLFTDEQLSQLLELKEQAEEERMMLKCEKEKNAEAGNNQIITKKTNV